MPEGLVTLGVSVVQILAGIFATIAFDSARSAASGKIKSQMVHADHFRRVVQTDINEVKEKINSMAQSRIYAAFDYVKRGLIILQGVAPRRTLSGAGEPEGSDSRVGILGYGNYPSYESYTAQIRALIKDAERFFVQADSWATEAFNDKANVPVPMRLECIRIQLFCAMLVHWDKPQQWLELWKNIFTNAIRDRGVAQTVLTFNPWVSKSQKALIKATLISVVNEAVCSLWKIAHDNLEAAETAAEVLNFIRAPVNVLQEQYHETWRNVIGLPMNSFTTWRDTLVVAVPDCYRICSAPDNCLCVIDRRFKIRLIDSITLQIVRLKKGAEDSDKEYSSVAYDPAQGLILAAQFNPNELRLFKFSRSRDGGEFEFMKSIQMPAPGHFVKCTDSEGHWVFRSASGRVYVMERGAGDWLPVTESVSKVFDAVDESTMTLCSDSDSGADSAISAPFYTSFGIRLLIDFKINSYYHNPLSSDSSKSVFLLKSSLNVNTKLISAQPEVENSANLAHQTFLSFDNRQISYGSGHSCLIAAQKLENNQIRLCKLVEKDRKKENKDEKSAKNLEKPEMARLEEFHHFETPKSADQIDLPFYFQEPIEDLLIFDGVIYLATSRSIELTKEYQRTSLTSAFKRFSLRFRSS